MPPPYCPLCGAQVNKKLALCESCLKRYNLCLQPCTCDGDYDEGPEYCKYSVRVQGESHKCACFRLPDECIATTEHKCICWRYPPSSCQAKRLHVCACPDRHSSECRASTLDHECVCRTKRSECRVTWKPGHPTPCYCIPGLYLCPAQEHNK